MGTRRFRSILLLAALLWPVAAAGQSSTNGAIAGTVRDTTGAVLPGVTVEAASPALIEKVRTAVTDSQGQYQIVDLRPGTYSVTFSLVGFSTVRREGITITASFTAPVGAEMRVGSLEETVTVTGASPVVDVQNVRTQAIITNEILDAVPTARSIPALISLSLGVVPQTMTSGRDVGGNAGDFGGFMRAHGSRSDGGVNVEGMNTMTLMASMSTRRNNINPAAVQEMVLQTSGMSAEVSTGGPDANFVIRDGGNQFSGTFNAEGTGKNLQSGNLSDALKANGLTRVNRTNHVYEVAGGFGGPLVRDKLWFWTAHRVAGAQQELAGTFFNKAQGTLFYEPDLNRPAYNDQPSRDYLTSRVTWQATSRQKVSFIANSQWMCLCFLSVGPARAPEASWSGTFPQRLYQGTWTSPFSSRLLFEAGAAYRVDDNVPIRAPGVKKGDRPVMDAGLGMWYGSMASGANPHLFNANGWLNDYGHSKSHYTNTRFAVSYVTGSHAIKVGMTQLWGFQDYGPGEPEPEAYQFRNRVPIGLWQLATPGYSRTRIKALGGVFVQDQWTVRRMTLNLGLRLDYLNAYNPKQTRPAGAYTPEFSFDEIPNVPNWRDLGPRLGFAYDVFGDGKTAVKASLGRYVVGQGTRIAQETNPADAIGGTTFRVWNDADGDYVPDCDLRSPSANGECGAMANRFFGTTRFTRFYDPDILEGWHVRPYNWQTAAGIQQELMPGMALNVAYHRTWFGNEHTTDNLEVAPSDYSQFCVTAPTDSRLPGGGGNRICGLYDLNPNRLGLVNNQVTFWKNFGDRTEVYNGVDISVNARFGNGGLVFGGGSIGSTRLNQCVVVDSPQLHFCDISTPENHVKLSASYPMPWGTQVAATYQNLMGVQHLANLVVGNAAIAPSLGRNLGACGAAAVCNATVVVPLIEPQTEREGRQSQLDLRVSKAVRLGPTRVVAKVDFYNLLNANDVQLLNTTYGAAWMRVASILTGRLVKFGAQLDF